MLTIFIIGSASAADGDVNSTEITAASEYDEIIDVENDLDELGDGEATYSDLRTEIGTDGNVDLTKSCYRYTSGDGDTIKIENRRVINGNGAVIDMEGSNIRAFYVNAINVTIKNLTIKNANYTDGDGGAIFFNRIGTVENCNFFNNSAVYGGALWFEYTSIVRNCTFTYNHGDYGGAIGFMYASVVSNLLF